MGYNFGNWEIAKMTRLIKKLVGAALVVSLSFINNAAAQNPGKTWMQYATPEEAGFSSDKLESVVDLYQKNGATALLIVYDGNVLLSKGDVARRYDTHSMRKSLVSALYGIYSGNGEIDIHKTLKDLGIDDSVRLSDEEQSATVQDLLKARSGIYIPAFGEAKSMENERPKRGSHPPNTFFYYNNWDFNVLGAIFQKQTGRNLFEAFDESLAKPLEMEDFRLIDGRFWRDSTRETIYPKYDIKISARDLARFGTLYCNGGMWNDRQILSKDWISESFNPYSTMDRGSYKESYGYLWWIQILDDSIPMYSALGWGGHVLSVVPKYKVVLVKRHDTFSGSGGDTKTGMYVRMLISAQTSAPVSKPKLVPLEVHADQGDFVEIPDTSLKKYEQDVWLKGRTRKIRCTKYGLLFDDWFVLHPVSDARFIIEDLDKHMYFKFETGKPVFDRIE
jgi:CubicO group peptidase (beta-lactamase class C family)